MFTVYSSLSYCWHRVLSKFTNLCQVLEHFKSGGLVFILVYLNQPVQHIITVITLSTGTDKSVSEHSVDSDQKLQNAASDQGLFFCPSFSYF